MIIPIWILGLHWVFLLELYNNLIFDKNRYDSKYIMAVFNFILIPRPLELLICFAIKLYLYTENF